MIPLTLPLNRFLRLPIHDGSEGHQVYANGFHQHYSDHLHTVCKRRRVWTPCALPTPFQNQPPPQTRSGKLNLTYEAYYTITNTVFSACQQGGAG